MEILGYLAAFAACLAALVWGIPAYMSYKNRTRPESEDDPFGADKQNPDSSHTHIG